MKHIFFIIAATIILSSTLHSCKTTEENYQKAYNHAREKQLEGLTDEEIAGFAREESMPQTVYKGDSIPLRAMYVNTVNETTLAQKPTTAQTTDNESTKAEAKPRRAATYNLIVASFKQQFNAASAIDRLRTGGYPEALLLIDRDKRFYVAAISTESLDTAVAKLRTLPSNSPVALRQPYPYILKQVR